MKYMKLKTLLYNILFFQIKGQKSKFAKDFFCFFQIEGQKSKFAKEFQAAVDKVERFIIKRSTNAQLSSFKFFCKEEPCEYIFFTPYKSCFCTVCKAVGRIYESFGHRLGPLLPLGWGISLF